MTRLLLLLSAAALLLPGAAGAAACSPLDCAPSQFTFAHGTLIGYRVTARGAITVADLRTGQKLFRLPGGFVYGDTVLHQRGHTIEWWDATAGRLRSSAQPPWRGSLVGASQDGSRAVLLQGSSAVIGTGHEWRRVPLPAGVWEFDALRGANLVLIKRQPRGSYQIWHVDLSSDSAPMHLLKDPHESGTIWGIPFERVASADGRYLFTLYITSNGASMVHELDLRAGTARCIDLPGTGDFGGSSTWALMLAPDGRTLWAASPGYGRVVAIDAVTRKVVDAFRIDLPYWFIGQPPRAAVSPDGTQFALADGETVALVDVHARRVVARKKAAHAIAVGYSPTTGELRTLR
jgi:hypothetical protein